MSGTEDADLSNSRKIKAPFSAHNPIPTIQHYREEKQQRAEEAGIPTPGEEKQGLKERYQAWKEGKEEDSMPYGQQRQAPDGQAVYPTTNENIPDGTPPEDSRAQAPPQDEEPEADGPQKQKEQQSLEEHDAASSTSPDESEDDEEDAARNQVGEIEDTSQSHVQHADPKTKRKEMQKRNKKSKGDRAERQVTDPVTHLPITIHDFTSRDLKAVPANEIPPRPEGDLGDEGDLKRAEQEQREAHEGMEKVFPPPSFDAVRMKVGQIEHTALLIGIGCVLVLMAVLVVVERFYRVGERLERKIFSENADGKMISSIVLLLFGAGSGGVVIWGIRDWADKRIEDIWESEIWEAERHEGKKAAKSGAPESTQWLNSLLASVWPLINPDLFVSLADTLEDVMQASLPKLVRMVSVDDIGQGSEAIRILGMRWLPHGAAARSVTSDGELKRADTNKPSESDRSVPGEGQLQSSDNPNDDDQQAKESREKRRQDQTSNEQIAEGMEAETGDFVNMEVAFAYRARATSMKGKFAGLRKYVS